jgi:hypothetical protein
MTELETVGDFHLFFYTVLVPEPTEPVPISFKNQLSGSVFCIELELHQNEWKSRSSHMTIRPQHGSKMNLGHRPFSGRNLDTLQIFNAKCDTDIFLK